MTWLSELVLEHRITAMVTQDTHLQLDFVREQMLTFEGMLDDEAIGCEELPRLHQHVSPNDAIKKRNAGLLIVDCEGYDATLVYRYSYVIQVATADRAKSLSGLLEGASLLQHFDVVQVRETLLRD